jgi:hypothetical protein
VRAALLVAGGLALLPAPAVARELPSMTPDPGVAAFDRDVSLIATNGSRTFVSGLFRYLGTRGGDGAVVSARSGAVRTVVPGLGWVSAAISDRAGGWYVGDDAGAVRHVRADGGVDALAAPSSDAVVALALSADARTLWVGGASLWAVDVASGVVSTWSTRRVADLALAPDGATLYAANRDAAAVAFDTATGALLASGPPGQGNSVVAAGDRVYAVLGTGRLFALEPRTLAERWGADGNDYGETRDMALTPDGHTLLVTRYATFGGPGVLAFDTASGARTAWTSAVESAGAIAVSGDVAYLGRAKVTGWPQAGAVAVSTRDGALLGWAPGTVAATSVDALAVAGDSVFVQTGSVIAERGRRGAVLDETGNVTPWTDPTGLAGAATSAAVGTDGTVYVAGPGGVAAVASDGTQRWRHDLDGTTTLALSPDGGIVYVVGASIAPMAIRASDGALLPWSLSVAGGAVEETAFSGGVQYLRGTFTSVNGVPRGGLAAINATGAVLPFAPALGGHVDVMRATRDALYVSGTFTKRFVGLRASDGATVFDPATGSAPDAILPLPDGETVLATYGETLLAYDAATGARLDWTLGGCGDCWVRALALSPDGHTLHVGGYQPLAGQYHRYFRLALGRPPSAPVNTTPPRIIETGAGFAECDPGTWSGHPTAYRYAWTLDGTPVDDFAGREFLRTPADTGHALRCVVTAGTASATSPPLTTPITPAFTPAPRRIGQPAPA